jgi:hypothetical protein
LAIKVLFLNKMLYPKNLIPLNKYHRIKIKNHYKAFNVLSMILFFNKQKKKLKDKNIKKLNMISEINKKYN